jgi:hypothetical protein
MPSNIVVASLNASTYENSTTRHFARCRLVAEHFDKLSDRNGIAFVAASLESFLSIRWDTKHCAAALLLSILTSYLAQLHEALPSVS